MKMKPHRPGSTHPAYTTHGVAHHDKMEHHPGKTHAHPHDPHMSAAMSGVNAQTPPPPAPPGGGAQIPTESPEPGSPGGY